MTEYSPEWYENEIKKCRMWTYFFAAATAILIIISPFFLIKTYPTIGINENNAKHITTQVTDWRELTDEESNSPYYEFKGEDGETYYIDWKSYIDVAPYIRVNGYENREFSFKVERTNNVIQMDVEGRKEPLIIFEEGYERLNSANMLDALPGVGALLLAGYCGFMTINKNRQRKKYIEESSKN